MHLGLLEPVPASPESLFKQGLCCRDALGQGTWGADAGVSTNTLVVL